jgi:hypothetical protein
MRSEDISYEEGEPEDSRSDFDDLIGNAFKKEDDLISQIEHFYE